MKPFKLQEYKFLPGDLSREIADEFRPNELRSARGNETAVNSGERKEGAQQITFHVAFNEYAVMYAITVNFTDN